MDKIHIGQMIQAVLEEQGRTMKWFAKNIHCDYSNAYTRTFIATIATLIRY